MTRYRKCGIRNVEYNVFWVSAKLQKSEYSAFCRALPTTTEAKDHRVVYFSFNPIVTKYDLPRLDENLRHAKGPFWCLAWRPSVSIPLIFFDPNPKTWARFCLAPSRQLSVRPSLDSDLFETPNPRPWAGSWGNQTRWPFVFWPFLDICPCHSPSPLGNFINVLRTAFTPTFFWEKITKPYCN